MLDLSKPLSVTLVTRSGCSLCEQTLELLHRLALDYPLAIAVLDADESEGAALAAESGVVLTPGLVIGDEVIASGRISERRVRKEIARRLGYPQLSESGISATVRRFPCHGRSLLGWLSRSW